MAVIHIAGVPDELHRQIKVLAALHRITMNKFVIALLEGRVNGTDSTSFTVGMTIEEVERRTIMQAMKFTYGNETTAAEILGISRARLKTKLEKYELTVEKVPEPA